MVQNWIMYSMECCALAVWILVGTTLAEVPTQSSNNEITTTEADDDACRPGAHGCDSDELCINTQDSYVCTCNAGYILAINDRQCIDLNECALSTTNVCWEGRCHNNDGGYVCGCPPGYHSDRYGKLCIPNNPCEENTCPALATCAIVSDETECRCPSGYTLNRPDNTCDNINECTDVYGDALCPDYDNMRCVDLTPSYACGCQQGYEMVGLACQDIDECSSEAFHLCHESRYCLNLLGGYECLCPSGYHRDLDRLSCNPATACTEDNTCPGDGVCAVIDDVNVCTCLGGFVYNQGNNSCDNVNECEEYADVVCRDPATHCVDTRPGYTCACNAGYATVEGLCIDEDECTAGTHNCEDLCFNSAGSFSCGCTAPTTLRADGRTCQCLAPNLMVEDACDFPELTPDEEEGGAAVTLNGGISVFEFEERGGIAVLREALALWISSYCREPSYTGSCCVSSNPAVTADNSAALAGLTYAESNDLDFLRVEDTDLGIKVTIMLVLDEANALCARYSAITAARRRRSVVLNPGQYIVPANTLVRILERSNVRQNISDILSSALNVALEFTVDLAVPPPTPGPTEAPGEGMPLWFIPIIIISVFIMVIICLLVLCNRLCKDSPNKVKDFE